MNSNLNNNVRKVRKVRPPTSAIPQNAQNQIKKLKQQRNKLKRRNKNLMVLNKNPFSEKGWYHSRVPGLFKQVNNYHDNALAEYVYGLFHPDAVFRENLNIKAPSIVPIPTTNFAFKETFNISPNPKGNFLLVWNPNYLGTSNRIVKNAAMDLQNNQGYFSNIYISDDVDLDGNSAAHDFWAQTFKHIVTDFSKYRLTSACLKVKYTGKVLDQSGMLAACASFMEFPRTNMIMNNGTAMTSTYTVPDIFPQLQRLGDFDNIRQGQWAKTINLVQQPEGLTCVYIPTDPLSQAFVDNADTITSTDKTVYHPTYPANGQGLHWYSKSANITFDVCGYGIYNPNDVPVITVEAYYNYEIIVNEDQMPFFRPTVASLTQKETQEITSVVNKITSTSGSIVETKVHDSPSVLTKIRGAISQGIDIADKLAPLIKLGIALM